MTSALEEFALEPMRLGQILPMGCTIYPYIYIWDIYIYGIYIYNYCIHENIAINGNIVDNRPGIQKMKATENICKIEMGINARNEMKTV
jgi:hypothetical protein